MTLWKRSKNSVFLLCSALDHSDKYSLVMLYRVSDGAFQLKEDCPKHLNSLWACSYISLLAEGRILLLDGFDMSLIFTNDSMYIGFWLFYCT